MKKHFLRWYEKNDYMCAFMHLLEQLPIDLQCEIAVDIIIEAGSLVEREYSKVIEDVGNFDPKDYKRWYDKNPNVHLAIETLRDLNDEQREKIIKKYSDEILNYHDFKLEGLDD